MISKLDEVEKKMRSAIEGGYSCLVIINGEYYGVEEQSLYRNKRTNEAPEQLFRQLGIESSGFRGLLRNQRDVFRFAQAHKTKEVSKMKSLIQPRTYGQAPSFRRIIKAINRRQRHGLIPAG